MIPVRRYRRGRPTLAIHWLTGAYPPEDVLVATRYRKDTDQGQMYAIDILLGDDQYVFLSTEAALDIYKSVSEGGFVFDAEELIKHGAKVRKEDVACLPAFEGLNKTLSDFTGPDDIWAYDADMVNELKERISENKYSRRAFQELQSQVQKSTLSGEEAVEFIKNPRRWPQPQVDCHGSGIPEILVPKRLPLAESTGQILGEW